MLSPDEVVGNYRITGTLGEGAVGTVFSAVHTVLGTEHALKLLRVDDPVARRRLVAEGRAQARLSHPNLVRVTDVVEVDGRPALIMDRIEGPTLGKLLRRARPTPADAERLWADIVAGVAAAHRAGLVHRDLKPANVLLDTHQQPPRARVTDFGIARALGVAGATQPGRMLGTFGFLAPEQLADASSVDARADVFSLGVLGVQLLTGRPPFPTDDVSAWLDAVAQGWEPPTGLPLGPLLAACLSQRPQERPEDADAVLRHLRPEQPAPAQRRRPAVHWALAGLLGLLVGLAFSLRPREAPPPLESLELQAWRLAQERPAEALALLRAAAVQRGRAPPDEVVHRLVGRGAASRVFPLGVDVSAVDQRAGLLAAAEVDGLVTVWESATGVVHATVPTGVHQPRQLTLLEDGSGFVVRPHSGLGRSETDALLWDLPTGAPRIRDPDRGRRPVLLADDLALLQLERAGTPQAVAWALDGTERWRRPLPARHRADGHAAGGRVALPTEAGVVVLDALDGTEVATLDVAEAAVPVHVSATGETVWVSDADGVARITLPDGPAEQLLPGMPYPRLVPGPGALLAATGHRGGQVMLLQPGGTPMALPHPREVVRPAFLDGQTLATGARDGVVRLWNSRGALMAALRGHRSQITAVAAGEEGVATASLDGTVRTWTDPARVLGVVERRDAPMIPDFSRAGLVAGADADGLTLWRPATGKHQHHPLGPLVLPRLGSDPAGRAVAVKSERGPTWVFLPETPPLKLATHAGAGWLAISPDLSTLAMAIRERLELWSLPDGTPLAGGPRGGSDPRVAWLPDSSAVLIARGEQGEVDVWTIDPPVRQRTLEHGLPEQRGLADLVVSPDGAWAVAGLYGGGAVAWELATGRAVPLGVGEADTKVVATDGLHALTAGRDGALTVWSLQTEEVVARWQHPGVPVTAALFDGVVVLGDATGQLLRWPLGKDPVLRPAHQGLVLGLFMPSPGALWSVGSDGTALRWALEPERLDSASMGRWSNLRVCQADHRVVPVLPYPAPDSVWAPTSACIPPSGAISAR